jgi:hypothetical protein
MGLRPGTDSSTAYSLTPGESTATKSAVQVTLPDSVLGPSGQVANSGSGFVVSAGGKSAPAAFIFATLDGHTEAWSPKVGPATGDARDEATVPGAGYTGLAAASTLPATSCSRLTTRPSPSTSSTRRSSRSRSRPGSSPTPGCRPGYRAFNTQVLDGHVLVAYDTLTRTPRQAPDRKASASAWWTSSAPMAG